MFSRRPCSASNRSPVITTGALSPFPPPTSFRSVIPIHPRSIGTSSSRTLYPERQRIPSPSRTTRAGAQQGQLDVPEPKKARSPRRLLVCVCNCKPYPRSGVSIHFLSPTLRSLARAPAHMTKCFVQNKNPPASPWEADASRPCIRTRERISVVTPTGTTTAERRTLTGQTWRRLPIVT